MTIIKNNPMLKGASGMVGKTVVFREWRGRLVMANRPKGRETNSPAQQVTITNFKAAGIYAKDQMANPEAKALYKTGVNRRIHSAYHAALSDFLNSPKVRNIDADNYTGGVGEIITIKAVDDFRIVRLTVQIIDSNGALIEEGEAAPYFRRNYIFKYTTMAVNANIKGTVVKVAAFDRPSNKGVGEIVL